MTTSCVHDHAPFTSRWGTEDRLGAGNLMTPASRLAALKAVEEAGVQIIYPDKTPFLEKVQPMLEEYKSEKEVYDLIQKIKNVK